LKFQKLKINLTKPQAEARKRVYQGTSQSPKLHLPTKIRAKWG
jgi:hypothetical protein